MMSRKILAQSTVLSLALALAACGGDDSSTSLSGVTDGSTGGGGGTTEDGGSSNNAEPSLALGIGSGSNFQSGQIQASTRTLVAGGSSALELSIVDELDGNSLNVGTTRQVQFTSPCISSGEAEIDSPVSSNSGVIETVYTANGCSGDDLVTATLEDAVAQVLLNVAPTSAFQISANTPEPTSIAPAGSATSSRPTVSNVSFNITDATGAPVRDAEVTFSLSYSGNAGSASQTVSLNPTSATSGAGGLVSTQLIAGSQNTVVRVVATITRENGQTASTTSPPIAINSSLPDQDSFSITTANFMPWGYRHDGTEVQLNIRAGDRFNNQVRGDAVVSFVTSGGSIQGDCTLDETGACSVTWISQAPVPEDGRITILARTVGDESFTDLNSNDEYDAGEPIIEAGEPYLDAGVNGSYDPLADTYFDYNGNGMRDAPDSSYSGSACLQPTVNSCSDQPVLIWDSVQMIMASTKEIVIEFFNDPDDPGNENRVCASVYSLPQGLGGPVVPVPAGTTISFALSDGTIKQDTTTFAVENAYPPRGGEESIACINFELDDGVAEGLLQVTVGFPFATGLNSVFDSENVPL